LPSFYLLCATFTLLALSPLLFLWAIQFGVFAGLNVVFFNTFKTQTQKKVTNLYSDMWMFITSFPYLRPWAFYLSLFGTPQDWTTTDMFNEFTYMKRAVFKDFRIWIVFRYVSTFLFSMICPLWGMVLWMISGIRTSRIIVNPPGHAALPEQQDPEEKWFFINGAGMDLEMAKLNATHLASIFKRPIELIYKPTYGIMYDIMEMIAGRTFDIKSAVDMTLQIALHDAMTKNGTRKVILITHSQGSIIACNAIRKMIENGSVESRKNIEKKLEVYNFANSANVFALLEKGPIYENFVNNEDQLARMSKYCKPQFVQYDKSEGKALPKIFVHKNPDQEGHLLGAHYLLGFVEGEYITADESNRSKLLSYIPKAK